MCYTLLYMLEWMRKKKYKIETPRTCGLHDSVLIVDLRPKRNSLTATSLLYKSAVQ